ncbi:MAG: ERCC4 domain-containing protein [Desulfovibrionaceae bacterium]|nr:ERCC4 domain-containing protein [Desulfovibrionaceae bacterium]
MDKTPLQIICDTREQKPWTFENYNVTVVRAGLRSGDYSLAGHEHEIALERKSLDDLVQSLSHGRTRFEAEIERLSAISFAAVLVEASAEDVARHRYQSQMNPASVMQSMFSWTVRYRVPFLLCGSRRAAEYAAHGLLSKYQKHVEDREKEKQAVTYLEGLTAKRSASRKREKEIPRGI